MNLIYIIKKHTSTLSKLTQKSSHQRDPFSMSKAH